MTLNNASNYLYILRFRHGSGCWVKISCGAIILSFIVCPRSSGPFHYSYFIKWVTTFWTYSVCYLSYLVLGGTPHKTIENFSYPNEI